MREVLFRGFHECENGDTIITINERKIKGIWVYGYYCFSPKRRGAFGQTVSELDFDTHYIVSPRGKSYKVIPETVGQCIGLPDKNGKKIYEGDFVAFEDGTSTEAGFMDFVSIGEVEWVKEIAGFTVSDRASADIECVFESCEVVGNKWDTPDLLNKTIGD